MDNANEMVMCVWYNMIDRQEIGARQIERFVQQQYPP